MNQVDLNCDLGESFGAYTIGMDEQVIPYISSANIACGYHASDPVVMQKTIKLAKENGIGVGAHPGFPDLMGFGRRNMNVSPSEVKAYVQYQIGALYAFCKAAHLPLSHVKPHGALYNMAGKDYKLAKAICEGILEFDSDLILMALSGSEMMNAAKDTGLKAAKEVFADRAYEEDGSLVARSKPGAMITDEDTAIQRVIRMIQEGKVTAVTGKDISIEADSVCVHGDGAKALEFVKKIRTALKTAEIRVLPLSVILS
jgi:5-oxoprolinase (ATP-hydrolysing) subunit A